MNAPFHAVFKFPWIVDNVTVVIVGVPKSVNDSHDNNAILKASEYSLSDEVLEETVSSKVDPSVSPGCNKKS